MARVDDGPPRARLDPAADLSGVDLILECERAASRRNPRDAIPNDGAKAPGAATSTPPLTPQASLTWSASSDDSAPIHNSPPPSNGRRAFFAEARTALSPHLVRWNVIRLAEQPPFCAGVEIGLNSIAVPLQSATPFRSWISI